jgi:Bacterial membrane protein YfhO
VLGFFLAVLAAIGFDSLQRPLARRRRRRIVTELLVGLIGVAGIAFALHRVQLASRGRTQVASSRYVLPVVAALLALGVVAIVSLPLRSKRQPLVRAVALASLPALVLVEGLAFVLPFWARVPVDDFYPRTPVHAFLAEHLDRDRFVASGGTMLTGTNVYYGLSTPNGHSFTDPKWRELLRAIDPAVFRTQTYSAFAGPMPLERATSPLFDRLGVKYLVVPPREATYGRTEDIGSDRSDVVLRAGGAADVPIGNGPLRGVSVYLREPLLPRDRFARVEAEVLDDRNAVVARAGRRTYDRVDPGPFLVPIAGEGLPPSGGFRVRLRLASADGSLRLAGAHDVPRVTVTRPAADGLRLVFADGAAVYHRLNALPRIRWAANVRVVADAQARVQALATEPSSPETLLVAKPVEVADGAPADVRVTTDSGDRVAARVNARGSGYMIVADARLRGWRARVDGHRVDLVIGDNALAAIPVPAGTHVVELEYRAPGARLGALISVGAAFVLACTGAMAVRRRARRHTEPRDLHR